MSKNVYVNFNYIIFSGAVYVQDVREVKQSPLDDDTERKLPA